MVGIRKKASSSMHGLLHGHHSKSESAKRSTKMSLNIPESPAGPNGTYHSRPSDYTDALEAARKLLDELKESSEWQDMPEKEDVSLSKIVDENDTSAIPTTRGSTVVEGIEPIELLGVLQLPGMRKKWDPRLDQGHAIRRFSQSSFELYSVMKSPSYFIWARDIAAVQESWWNKEGTSFTLVQVSISDEDNLPEDGSYAKSRTRATVDLSAWQAEKTDNGTKLSYVVKVHLNGSLPTAIVQTLALETPMCVGRVRDVAYETGHAPVELTVHNAPQLVKEEPKTVAITQTFDDDAGEKVWTGDYAAAGEDSLTILYDGKRMYVGGVDASISSRDGNDVSAIKAEVDESSTSVKVTVPDSVAKGTTFEVVIKPSE